MTARLVGALLLLLALTVISAAAQNAESGPQLTPVVYMRVLSLRPDITAPVVVTKVEPVYPEQAKSTRIQGAVLLRVVVEADGTVSSVTVTRGVSPELDQRAVDAARRWTFKPGVSGGRFVRVGVQIAMDYQLIPAPAPASDEFGKDAHREGEPGFVMPITKQSSYPAYPTAAMAAKIQGEVVIEAVVLENGTVGEVRIQQSLDTKFGLDDAALSAARRWVFEPAKLDGIPARAVVKMIMEFRLH